MQQQPTTICSKKQQISPYSQLSVTTVIQNNKQVHRYKIGKYQYNDCDFLGQGFCSKVYKATLLTNKKQRYAIKVIDLSKFVQNQKQLLQTQINVICSLNHPNLIKCIDVYKTDINYFIIMEYCPHGDLSELIRLQNFITQDKCIPIFRQILDGYKYLMNKNIIHRDLKPANIMRFSNQWKIGDFGFAKYCKQQYLLQKLYVGTPFYMPPESLQLNKYSVKSDIFALGVILYEMLTGQTPWPAKDQKQLIDFMKQNQVNLPRFLVSQQIKQFLNKTLVLDYYTRMTKQQFKKFTLDNIDLQKLSKIKPRGISPHLKRQLTQSGKKSYMFSTPLKFTKNSFFLTSQKQKQQVQAKSSNKPNMQNFRFLLQQQFGLQNSPSGSKLLRENYQIMNNQLEIVKVINSFIHNCSIFELNRQEYNFLCIFMYRISLKLLKMVSNKRQNTYKFGKWDVFRQSDKFRTCVTVILSYVNKLQAQFNKILQQISEQQIKKFSTEFPDLVTTGAISFKIFAKIYQKLRQFINSNILNNHQLIKSNAQCNLNLKCYAIYQLLEIMNTIKNRTQRQQQIKGFGLKTKPECSSLKILNCNEQTLGNKVKQLQILCSQKIKIQQNHYFN